VATIETMIHKKEKAIMGPIEFYYVTKDEQDLLETIGLLLQAKNIGNIINLVKRNQQKMKWSDDDVMI